MDIIDSNLIQLNTNNILDNLSDGVVAIDQSGEILYMNKAAKEIVSSVGEDKITLQTKCTDVMGHSGCTLGCLLKKTMDTEEPIHNYESAFVRGGKTRHLSINTALLRNEEGKVIGGVEILKDVTKLKELELSLKEKYSFNNFIGKNHKIREVFELIKDAAPTKSTILIEGETGTGKELIANAIFHNSPRNNKPFIKFNCAALTESLVESELFGHKKGAFTGAISDKPGRFSLANEGTLFLDEVADLTPKTQVKLLRALQEGEFEPIGGTKTLKVDVRIIAATNKNLKEEVARGAFREDLYYRLKVVTLELAPLRNRRDDIPILVNHFKNTFNDEMKKKITNISPAVMNILMDHDYPGNVRELEHIIEHGFVRCGGKTLNPEHLPKDIRTNNKDILNKAVSSSEPMKILEKEIIEQTLRDNNWNYSKCSEKLGMSRTTLWRKLKKFNIEKRENRLSN